jgi:hypothetical protein
VIVPITQVLYETVTPSRLDVKRMKGVLQRQGQIEPLQVREHWSGLYCTFSKDPWGSAMLVAAQELGWRTLLITVMQRYEE